MQEISSAQIEEYKENESSEEVANPILISKPNSFIWEWLLAFSTFNMYSNYWFFARTRELNKVSNSSFTPWLWLFVPFGAIFQLFAFRRLGNGVEEIESGKQVVRNRKLYIVGCIGFIVSTAFFSFTSELEVPYWLEGVFYLTLTFAFALMTQRVNAAKYSLKSAEFKPRNKFLTALRWLLVITLFPIILGGFIYVSYPGLFMDKLDDHSGSTVYRQENKSFEMPFSGNGWFSVESGTFSNGTALAEFSNSVFDSYVLIFENKNVSDVNEHMSARKDWVRESFSDVKCKEKRSFVQNTMTVKIEAECTGTQVLDPAIVLITFIQADDTNYEFLGVLTAPDDVYKRQAASYKSMAREFTVR